MTATFLQSELQSLIQESKRKSPETRSAAEKSLADLKSLSITSESQLSGDLVRKPRFIDPFVFACRSRNVKLASISINCLQRLAAGRAIPQEQLSDVLDALREIATLSLDIQLKTLQTLPSLLQLYSSDIRGSLLAVALEICDKLQGSKTAVVSSTAEATLQQLVATLYDRVSSEDAQPSENSSQSVQVGSRTINVGPAAHDAFRVFADLCAMANSTQPTFVQLKTLSPHFLLEVIGSIATNYSSIIVQHPEQLEVCRSALLPALGRVIATKSSFAVLVRALRTFYVLLQQHLRDMVTEFEDGLLSMLSLLEPSATQPWRRVLSMEVFRGICSDASLFRDLYRLYDDTEDRKNIIGDLLAAFVHIASEDPTLIGLGRQSTMPSRQGEATNGDGVTSFEASDIGGAVGGVVSASATVTGLSTEWSTVKVPCLEQLDKSNLSDIPTTYAYSLVLNCISALAEGLSRFVMPLSVPSKVHTQRTKNTKIEVDASTIEDGRPTPTRAMTNPQIQSRMINPLTLDGHSQLEALGSCSRMLDNCWPAILATCATFFNAALDAEYYHNLVRAFQKLTQVSGVLELATARDALLTTLSKAAVPSSTNTRLFSPSIKQNDALEEGAVIDATVVQTPQSAVTKDFGQPWLSVRNLLCLRALLNLGIALGPSLGADAWFIILETLERAEFLITSTNALQGDSAQTEERQPETGDLRTLFGVEAAAVQTATKRMFESTSTYTDEAFALFVTSLFRLDPVQESLSASNTLLSPTSPTGTPSRARMHLANRSVSALWTSPEVIAGDQTFVISKIAELARTNVHRFLLPQSSVCSWQLLVKKLLDIFASKHTTNINRSKSADEMNIILLDVVKALQHDEEEIDTNASILKHCFDVLLAQLQTIQVEIQSSEAESNLNHESHTKLLATLETIIGHCGDTLTEEWTNVLKLISSAFLLDGHEGMGDTPEDDLKLVLSTPRSEAILQASFACLQLLMSDFLGALIRDHLKELTMLLFSFGSQDTVLNISLTATTFFWNIALLLLETMRSMANSSDSNSTREKSNLADARRIFMLLFSNLSLLSLDSRSDVRQSSIRMTTRVLEAASDQLSPAAWNTCISRLLALCSGQVSRYNDSVGENKAPWQEAAVQTLTDASNTVTENIQAIRGAGNFKETWAQYLRVSGILLDQKTLPMSNAAYRSLATMLRSLEAEDIEQNHQRSESVLKICLDHHPADIDPGKESNQAALTQFAATFAAIFSVEPELEADPQEVVRAIERTVLECVHPPYTSDIKTLAPEQVAVVALLPRLERVLSGSAYTELLQTFMKAPLNQVSLRTNATFIALASRCVDILRETVTDKSRVLQEAFDMVSMLDTFTQLIATKYTALPQGGPSPLWRNATTGAVRIIESKPQVEASTIELPRLTGAFTALATAVLQAGGLSTAHGLDLTDDESFDMSSFLALHAAIAPSISHSSVPPMLLKSYILTLFHASLIAEPFYFDLPDDMLDKPLEGFSTVRLGTVCDPIYARRTRICYIALDILFSLIASGEDMSTEALRLAQTAAPYVLLRCAYTLKSFMADQPLRSISALPQPLRAELLTVLNKCVELRCREETFAGLIKGNQSDGKAHLRLLNGLVIRLEKCWRGLPKKATGVNWQDQKDGREIEEALVRWRACLAEGWEV